MNKDDKKTPFYLDLEDPNNTSGVSLEGLPENVKKAFQSMSTDEKSGEVIIERFINNKQAIGKRIKEMSNLGISYDTKSVKLYHQAKELYCLGYFESAIMVCRATAEYLANEIFVEQVDIHGERETIEQIAEDIDFRKIVNNFLYSPKRPKKFIDESSKNLFNSLYDLGNKWIHPNLSKQKKLEIDAESKKAIEMLRELINSLRGVLIDYQIEKRALKLKPK